MPKTPPPDVQALQEKIQEQAQELEALRALFTVPQGMVPFVCAVDLHRNGWLYLQDKTGAWSSSTALPLFMTEILKSRLP